MAQSTLAAVVTKRTAAADEFLESNPPLAALANQVAAIVRDVRAEGAPFADITLDVEIDPEVDDWTELVFVVDVDAKFDETMHWGRRIGHYRADLSRSLSADDRLLLADQIGIHLESARV